jgi:hypothetical protein
MELDRIYSLAKRLKRKLHCSQQMAEYIASILAWEHSVGKARFELLAEIQAIHTLHTPSAA